MAQMLAASHEHAFSLRPGFGNNPGALQMVCYVPNDLPPRAPLVVVLHGANQTASGYAVSVRAG